MNMKVGFIGLGRMGSAIARNLLKGGHELIAWNRSPAPVKALTQAGARPAEAPADVFAAAEVVFSMLADDAVVESVVLDSGALDAAEPGAIHVNVATISVALAERLERLHRDRGLSYVAAPVLGRPDVAAAGNLIVLPAGETAAIERIRPLLALFARRIFLMGEQPSKANVAKLACNFALAAMLETLGEAGALAATNGVAPETLFEVMTETVFAAPAYKTYAPLITERRFCPASFALPLGFKDVRLALQAAEAKHAPMPIASVLRDQFLAAIAHGDSELDWSALSMVAFRAAGLAA
jgi:3-hydroxyisobutyrate dehydrogenase-like beta-hydroxyacid dehydrogenase